MVTYCSHPLSPGPIYCHNQGTPQQMSGRGLSLCVPSLYFLLCLWVLPLLWPGVCCQWAGFGAVRQMQPRKGVLLPGLCPLSPTQSHCCGPEAGETQRGSRNLSSSALTVDFLLTSNQLCVTLSNKRKHGWEESEYCPVCESSHQCGILTALNASSVGRRSRREIQNFPERLC